MYYVLLHSDRDEHVVQAMYRHVKDQIARDDSPFDWEQFFSQMTNPRDSFALVSKWMVERPTLQTAGQDSLTIRDLQNLEVLDSCVWVIGNQEVARVSWIGVEANEEP